ncbi:MAG TPA: maleylpyruvate isomerase N-terminal domain-containing protein [Pseudonocardiaceae bacterium]|nr:maleylpyruvate isomerase N-terminal domain-containing protein [Pseudonocardiaceae bacterium]
MVVDGYLAGAELAAELLRNPAVGHHWTEPSALPEYRISGLAGHLAIAVFHGLSVLDTPLPDGTAPVDAVVYYSRTKPGPPLDAPLQQRIREVSQQQAGADQADLIGRVDATLAALHATVPTVPLDRLVCFRDRVLPYGDWLLTRLVELAVHMDDLAVSLDIETPELPPPAADLVLTTLVRVAAVHHGPVAVLRALSRRERAVLTISAF